MTPEPASFPLHLPSPRSFHSKHDLLDMQQLLVEGRSGTNDWHYPHVGELTFAYSMVACHLNPQEHIRLWHDDQGILVGYAILGEDPSIDWQVSPAYEWSGIEGEMMQWADVRLAELRERDAKQWAGSLRSGARQENGRRRVFLGEHGFRYSGEFAEVNMLKSLAEPTHVLPAPAGYVVRAVADESDIPQRAAAHRAIWQPWTDGDVTNEAYAALMKLPGYDRDLDVIAVAPGGMVVATANGWLDPVNSIGCIGQVGTLPAHRRRGLSRAVLLELLHRMRARSMDRACVSTGVSNVPAIRLYQSIGFEIVNQYLDYVRSV